jgi:phage gp16-like protein
MTEPGNTRNAQLAKIHIAKKALALDDDAYRQILWTIARVRSARDLDDAGRRRVLDHFRACGWRPAPRAKRRHHAGAPHNIDSEERGPMLRKIEAYLAEAKRPWAYADGMARRMFHVDRIALCSPAQLHNIIAALEKDARRHNRYRGVK